MKPVITFELLEADAVDSIRWSAHEIPLVDALDRTIQMLGQVRADQAPQVTLQRPGFLQKLDAIADAAWAVVPTTNGLVLNLRHPGFGWLHFQVAEPEKLLHELTKQTAILDQLRNEK